MRAALRVRPREQLRGRLAEEHDLRLDGGAHLRVEAVEVDRALVGEVVEDIQRLGGRPAALLAAEDEVDPQVQVL